MLTCPILLLDCQVYDSKWSFQYGERGGLIPGGNSLSSSQDSSHPSFWLTFLVKHMSWEWVWYPPVDSWSRGAHSSPLSTLCQIYNKEHRNSILESRCKSKRGARKIRVTRQRDEVDCGRGRSAAALGAANGVPPGAGRLTARSLALQTKKKVTISLPTF